MASKRGIQKVETATDADWTLGTGTFTEIPIGSLLKEEFDLGGIEKFETEFANLTKALDGVRYTGVMLVERGATGPADGTTIHLKVTPENGAVDFIGGENGARVQRFPTNLRPLDSGRAYDRIEFTYAGATGADVLKDAP